MLTRSDVAMEIRKAMEAEAKRRETESFLRAVYEGDRQRALDMLEGFAEFGKADPNSENAAGMSALEIARKKGRMDIAVDLLKAGARRPANAAPAEDEGAFWKEAAAGRADKGDWEAVELVLREAPTGNARIDLSDRESFWLEPWKMIDAAERSLSLKMDDEALSMLRINRDFLRMDLGEDVRLGVERRVRELREIGQEERARDFEGFLKMADPAPEPESADFAERLIGRRLKAGESAEDFGNRAPDRPGA